jgi:hypothetical protein
LTPWREQSSGRDTRDKGAEEGTEEKEDQRDRQREIKGQRDWCYYSETIVNHAEKIRLHAEILVEP